MPRPSYRPTEHPREEESQSFRRRLEEARQALVSVSLSRLGNLEAAEDVAQEALALAWERRDQLRDDAAFGGWLFQIAVNCCRQWQRGHRRRRAFLAEYAAQMHSLVVPHEHLLRRETIRETRRALASVPERTRVALLMRASGYSYAEIAEFLDLSVGAVRGRVARARERLRRDLLDRLEDEMGGKEKRTDDST